jgi:multisubunit Na+/H+ antiporter MnhG subunit
MATGHEDFSRTHDVKASSNRGFGSVFSTVFLIVGMWPLFFGGAPRWWSLIVAALFMLVTVAAPALLALPNRLWLCFGLLLNRIISPIVLAFLFYVIVTPMGMLMQAVGKDNLRLRRADADASYWIKRDPPGPKPDSLYHQF